MSRVKKEIAFSKGFKEIIIGSFRIEPGNPSGNPKNIKPVTVSCRKSVTGRF